MKAPRKNSKPINFVKIQEAFWLKIGMKAGNEGESLDGVADLISFTKKVAEMFSATPDHLILRAGVVISGIRQEFDLENIETKVSQENKERLIKKDQYLLSWQEASWIDPKMTALSKVPEKQKAEYQAAKEFISLSVLPLITKTAQDWGLRFGSIELAFSSAWEETWHAADGWNPRETPKSWAEWVEWRLEQKMKNRYAQELGNQKLIAQVSRFLSGIESMNLGIDAWEVINMLPEEIMDLFKVHYFNNDEARMNASEFGSVGKIREFQEAARRATPLSLDNVAAGNTGEGGASFIDLLTEKDLEKDILKASEKDMVAMIFGSLQAAGYTDEEIFGLMEKLPNGKMGKVVKFALISDRKNWKEIAKENSITLQELSDLVGTVGKFLKDEDQE